MAARRCTKNWSEHKRIGNEITTDLIHAKAVHCTVLFTEINTTKTYWNLVLKAITLRQKTVVGPLKTESCHLVVKDHDNACLMNTYITPVGEKLAFDLPPSITRSMSYDSLSQTKIVVLLSEVNFSEVGVRRQLKHLKSNSLRLPVLAAFLQNVWN